MFDSWNGDAGSTEELQIKNWVSTKVQLNYLILKGNCMLHVIIHTHVLLDWTTEGVTTKMAGTGNF